MTNKNLFIHYELALLTRAKATYMQNEITHIKDRCNEATDKATNTKQLLKNLAHNSYLPSS